MKVFEKVRQNLRKKLDFVHRLAGMERPGSRELRAVKIPTSYDAWRPPRRGKNYSGKNQCFGFWKSVLRHFSWILAELDNFRRQNQIPHVRSPKSQRSQRGAPSQRNTVFLLGGDRESFRGSLSKKFDFAHRLDAVARLGSRELRAVKIPASCDAWRPPKRGKTHLENTLFF